MGVGIWVASRRRRERFGEVMDENVPITSAVPAGWLEALARSEAELAAGQTVPVATVHRRIRESIARIEANRVKPRVSPASD